MPTIKQLPLATSVAASDLLPVSQGTTTRGLAVGQLLSSTQTAITLTPGQMLGRVSSTSGGPEAVTVGSGLGVVAGTLNATAADHVRLPVSSQLSAGDEVIVNTGGAAERMPATLLRGLFAAGSGVTIDASGTISATGGASSPATSSTLGAVKVGSGLKVAADGTLSADTVALSTSFATPASVQSTIQAVVGSAPAALATLAAIDAQMQSDETAAAALTSAVAGKLGRSANLGDLASAPAARANLGLAAVAASGAYSDLTGTPAVPVASSAAPNADGVAAAGTGAAYSRADHVHPSDTTRLAGANNLSDVASVSAARVNLGLGNAAVLSVGQSAGTVAAGNDARIVGALQGGNSLSDVGNTGAARSNLGLSGLATASVGSGLTLSGGSLSAVATAATSVPLADGLGAAGSAASYARADHVHPTDTTRAPLDSPAFTTKISAPYIYAGAATWLDSVATLSGVTDEVNAASGGIQVQSPTGHPALQVAHRSSDNSYPGGMTATIQVFPVNDNATQVQTSYGLYIEPHRAAGAGATQGIEIGMINGGATVPQNPFNMASPGVTPAYWASAGKSGVTSNPASSAFGIIANGTTFDSGILFDANALTLHGGVGYAVGMGTNQALTWWSATNQAVNAQITSTSNSTSGSAAINFSDTGIDLVTRSGNGIRFMDNMGGMATPPNNETIYAGYNYSGGSVEASFLYGFNSAGVYPQGWAFYGHNASGTIIQQFRIGQDGSLTAPGTATFGSLTLSTALSIANGGTGATTASGARAALSLGGSATLNVGTTSGTVAAGDDSRIAGALQSGALPSTSGLYGGSGAAGAASAVTVGAGLALSGGVLSVAALNPISATYTAPGAITPANTLALLNASSALAMTLAAAADTHGIAIVNAGSASATVTLSLFGTSQPVTVAPGGVLNVAYQPTLSTYIRIA